MKKAYKNCQSCGMPMKKSPNGGGTNADQSTSSMYCFYCYENGHFTRPDWTAEQMKDFSKEKMVEMGFPRFIAAIFTKHIPKLQRWKSE